MKSRLLGAGIMMAAMILLPLSARAGSSALSVDGSTVNVRATEQIPVTSYQGGTWNIPVTVNPSTATQNINIISTFSIVNPGYVAVSSGGATVAVVNDRFAVESLSEIGNQNRLGRVYHVDTGPITTGATSEVALALFVNLSTNTKTAYIAHFYMNPSGRTSTIGIALMYRIYLDPVVTSSGTPQGILSANTSFLANKSQMLAFTTPTVSSNGTLIHQYNVSGTTLKDELDGSFIITPGFKMLITVFSNNAADVASATLKWVEK